MKQFPFALFAMFLCFAGCAQPERLVNLQSIPTGCYLTSVTREKLLKCISDIKLVKDCFNCSNYSEAAAKIARSPHSIRQAELLAIAIRHGKYTSGLLFKRSENKYLLSFVGRQECAGKDTDACINVASTASARRTLWCTETVPILSSMPEYIKTRFEDRNSYGADFNIGVHTGFYLAGRPALETIAQAIQKDATPGLPIRVLINGHSMGGALAFQAAYFLKKVVPGRLGLSPDNVQVNLATFAAAGYFHEDYFKMACEVIGPHNALVFRRPSDVAVHWSSCFDFYNPACVVQLDYDTDGSDHALVTYEESIRKWTDPGIKRFNTLVKKAQGRRDPEYPSWKYHLMQAKLRLKYPSESDSSESY